VIIKGINIGGWLMMEGYILAGRNISESSFKKEFVKKYKAKGLIEFEKAFRDNFISEDDFKNISQLGANTVRLPFNHRLIESKPYKYDRQGLAYLEKALSWAAKYGLKVILDLHAAPGSQNNDWHSDSDGSAMFWKTQGFRDRACALWQVLADKFKDSPALLGYDILNEPVLDKNKKAVLIKFYQDAVNAIRKVDKKNKIFLEGNTWATDIEGLEAVLSDNIGISVHSYVPLDYSFNFVPGQSFPGISGYCDWNEDILLRHLGRYAEFAQKNKIDIWVGEFGINWRGGFYGEGKWLESNLNAFQKFSFGYTYWTYKAVANSVFPDGIYQFMGNPKYVRREGPIYGWENYLEFWGKEKKEIIDFWKTENFQLNQKLSAILSKDFRAE
jgi:endoglucanase